MDQTHPDSTHTPRFVQVSEDGHGSNRLARETSPYLLQHATNPVDWYPWGPEAFEAARNRDCPLFLSVGYSTCYWCHVMERESFEDPSVAAAMNENFVCVKVDREERPDVDELYMTAVQLFSHGHGGWPMSVFLEPAGLRPFFAGTYFPPRDLNGRPGMLTLVDRIASAWRQEREPLIEQAERAATAIAEELDTTRAPASIDDTTVDRAVRSLLDSFDRVRGGFDQAPKFPQPSRLQFLMAAAPDREEARRACQVTLDAMARGGICDQVGGGFHRYSTDARWLVPHFEKMLYDNALLAETYALDVERTGDAFHARALRRTVDYVLREMTAPEGRFYSAQDAEVDAREGASYVWSHDAFVAALEAHDLRSEVEFASRTYGLDLGPNFRDPHHADAPAVNVLFLAPEPDALGTADFARLDRINAALLIERNRRPQPITDDKSLAGWNGLMIAGLAEAGRVLGDERYVAAAIRAAEFVLREMRDARGRLRRSYRAGRATIDGFLEDYAFVIHGMFRLHGATGDPRWRDAASDLIAICGNEFGQPGGGYLDVPDGTSDLFAPVRTRYDGAIPSGNSQMILNLLEAWDATRDERYLQLASDTLAAVSPRAREHPTAALVAMRGLDRIAREHPALLPGADVSRPTPTAPVKLSVAPERIELNWSESTVRVRLDIASGYHVNAHEPGVADLTGLELRLTGEGVHLEVDYPPAIPWRPTFTAEEVRVHEGSIELRARMRRTGKLSAEPKLVLRWQACRDDACLAPAEQTVGLSIVEESES